MRDERLTDGPMAIQVGAKDGRIKVVGREGVEATFTSEAACATRYMQFLTGRGVLLRVTQAGPSANLNSSLHGNPSANSEASNGTWY